MKSILVGLTLVCAAPASAEVVSASATGFEVRHVLGLVVPPGAAFGAFAALPGWWDPQHTYSGKAQNLSFDLSPGGCFCERFPNGGGIEHMRVTFVDPGKRIVMTGSLGPLLFEATAGVMDIEVKSAAGGSRLVVDYRAAGFAKGGADRLAPIVDAVLAGQLKRFRAYAITRPRT